MFIDILSCRLTVQRLGCGRNLPQDGLERLILQLLQPIVPGSLTLQFLGVSVFFSTINSSMIMRSIALVLMLFHLPAALERDGLTRLSS